MKYMRFVKARYLYAIDGKGAVELYNANSSIDLVLLDLQLPDISGYEVTKEILKINPNAKVIAQTAHAYAEDRIAAHSVGCCDYITKPINMELLFAMMQKHL